MSSRPIVKVNPDLENITVEQILKVYPEPQKIWKTFVEQEAWNEIILVIDYVV